MRSYYCALETYPEDAFVQLIGDSAVKGLILGDRFCQKRMFPDGLAQEIVFMKQAMESGKELLYQTPLYVTTRNWDTVLSIVKLICLNKDNLCINAHIIGSCLMCFTEKIFLR